MNYNVGQKFKVKKDIVCDYFTEMFWSELSYDVIELVNINEYRQLDQKYVLESEFITKITNGDLLFVGDEFMNNLENKEGEKQNEQN